MKARSIGDSPMSKLNASLMPFFYKSTPDKWQPCKEEDDINSFKYIKKPLRELSNAGLATITLGKSVVT